MRLSIQTQKRLLKLIPYIEIIIGVIFLSSEVYDYITLYSLEEADRLFSGLVDFSKYKEDTYCLIFLWMILTFTGISYWVNKKLYWILTETFVFVLLIKGIFPYYAIFIELNPITYYIIPLIYSAIFIWIEIILFKIKRVELTNISIQTKLLGVAIGSLSCIIYILLFLNIYQYWLTILNI